MRKNKEIDATRPIVYFLDNAAIHCSSDVLSYFTENKLEVLFGVPYTPELNAIEFFFADIKKAFYGTEIHSR